MEKTNKKSRAISRRNVFQCDYESEKPTAIDENPLGLLIVLNGRRRGPSIGLNSDGGDGNRSDDNNLYSSDTGDEDDYSNNEARRAYLSVLNDEFALASYKQQFHFEPCRKMTKDPAKRNVYAKTTDRQNRKVSDSSRRKISDPADHRHFWSPSSSWSAIGRFFGKLKHGSTKNSRRRFSLQDEKYHERRYSNSCDNRARLLKKLEVDLQTGERKTSRDVSQYKVVSRHSDDSSFTITTNGGERLAICKEYFSRLTCYDAMPQYSQVVAIDAGTPMLEVLHILHRHRTLSAVLWEPSGRQFRRRKLCDIGQLTRIFWPLFTTASSSTNTNVSEYLTSPVGQFCNTASGDDGGGTSQCGVTADTSLIECARLLCGGLVRLTRESGQYCGSIVVGGRCILPMVNEKTGDVVHTLTANEILHFLCKELCKFGLASAFDDVSISDIARFKSPDLSWQKWKLYCNYSLKEASAFLIDSDLPALPVFKEDTCSYATTFSFVDLVDILINNGYTDDAMLAKKLTELEDRHSPVRFQTRIPVYDLDTPVSNLLQMTSSLATNLGNWNSLLPVAAIVDSGEFVGYLESEDLLSLLLPVDGQGGTQGGMPVKVRKDTTYGQDGHDSGVGEDELMCLEEAMSDL